MNIYLILPVRNNPIDASSYVADLEARGHCVHYPPRDAPQECQTGETICIAHRKAMNEADEVHVIWDVDSRGSHFDLGMAYALRKKIVPVCNVQADTEGKSYWKAVITAQPRLFA